MLRGLSPLMRGGGSRWARTAKPSAPRASAAARDAVAMRMPGAVAGDVGGPGPGEAELLADAVARFGVVELGDAARAWAASPACAAAWAMPASAAGRIRTGSELRSRTELSRNQRSAARHRRARARRGRAGAR